MDHSRADRHGKVFLLQFTAKFSSIVRDLLPPVVNQVCMVLFKVVAARLVLHSSVKGKCLYALDDFKTHCSIHLRGRTVASSEIEAMPESLHECF